MGDEQSSRKSNSDRGDWRGRRRSVGQLCEKKEVRERKEGGRRGGKEGLSSRSEPAVAFPTSAR